jgi:hypothetical protein
MSEREVVMRIVARDVKYDSNVEPFASKVEATLTARDPIAKAIELMSRGRDNIPIVDRRGAAEAVLRTIDIINALAEAFPAQALNLPPRPHQILARPEGG